LKSALSQKVKAKLEIIVVDDHSKPPLKSSLKKVFPNVKFIKNKSKHSGPAISRNVGMSNSSGDYIAFLDNDDKWKKDFLQSSLRRIKGDNSPATVCLTDQYYYGYFPFYRKVKLNILNLIRLLSLKVCFIFNKGRLPKSAFYLCQISHMLFDRKYINKTKFNEKAIAAEDWEFNLNISLKKAISIVPEKLVHFRYVLKSITFSDKLKLNKEKSYEDLISKMPDLYKRDLFYYLFLIYVKLFLVK